jgi:hypothetical protein
MVVDQWQKVNLGNVTLFKFGRALAWDRVPWESGLMAKLNSDVMPFLGILFTR